MRIRKFCAGALALSLVAGNLFSGGAFADEAPAKEALAEEQEVESGNESSRLVIKTSDPEAIPGIEVVAGNGDVFLVDVKGREEEARQSLAEAGVVASPDTVILPAYGSEDVELVAPEDLDFALNKLGELESQVGAVPLGENTIALIDSGANEGVLARYSLLNDEGSDAYGHGQAMVDTMRKTDPSAAIISIKALNDEGLGSVSSVYGAIKLAIDMNVKVINLSLVAKSMEENRIITDIIREAIAKNIIVVGAAGNFADDAANYVPGCVGEAIVVGACDGEGKKLMRSNYGFTVDWNVVAPSTSFSAAIMSAFIAGNAMASEQLNARLAAEVGKGLIFSPTYEPPEETLIDDWVEIEKESAPENLKEFFEIPDEKEYENAEVSSVRYSKEENIVEKSVTSYCLPEDGSFVGAWNYPSITTKMYLQGGSIGATYKDYAGSTGQAKEESTGLNRNAVLYGLDMLYTPGSMEQTQSVTEKLGGNATAENFKFMYFYSNGPNTTDMVANGANGFVSNGSPICGVQIYSSGRTLNKLYSTPLTVYRTGSGNVTYTIDEKNDGNRKLGGGRAISTPFDADKIVFLDESVINQCAVYVFPKNGTISEVLVQVRPRLYEVYYQSGYDETQATKVGQTSYVGLPFNFTEAEAQAESFKDDIIGFKSWNYEDAFGSKPTNSTEITPSLETKSTEDDLKYMFLVKANVERQTVTYDFGDGRDPEVKEAAKGGGTELENPPEREGYRFVGWELTSPGGGDLEDAGTGRVNNITEDITLTAKWELENYTIHYGERVLLKRNESWQDNAAGNAYGNQLEYNINSKFNLINPASRPGYEFLGWVEGTPQSIDATAGSMEFTHEKGQTGDKYYTALFTQVGFKINYDLNDNDGTSKAVNDPLNPLTFLVDDTLNILPPKRSGYTFTGWSGTGLTGEGNKEVQYKNQAQDLSLKAHWRAVTYSISFDGNGSNSGQNQNIKTTFDKIIRVPENTFKRPGYEFIGYSEDKDGEAIHFPGDEITNLVENEGGDIRFYAKWRQIPVSAKLTVLYEDSLVPVKDMEFCLVTGAGTLVENSLFTDEKGCIEVSGLAWNDPTDDENKFDNGGGNNGTEYVFVAKDTLPGFEKLRDAAFIANAQNAGKVEESRRVLTMERKKIRVSSRVDEVLAGRVPSFIYQVKGTNIAGVEHTYTLVAKVDKDTLMATGEIEVPVGVYMVSPMEILGYVPTGMESEDGYTDGVTSMQVDLANSDGGELSFLWERKGFNRFESCALKVNSFRK